MNRITVLVAGEGGGLHTEPNCPRCDDLPEEVVEAYLRNPAPDRPQVPNRTAPPSLKPPAERPTACPDCGGKRYWCFDDQWDPMCFACATAPVGAAPEPRKAVG